MEELIQSMVQVDSSKRPASIAEVKEALQHLVDNQEKARPRLWRPPEGPLPLPMDDTYSATQTMHAGSGQPQLQVKRAFSGFSRRKFITRSLAIGGTAVLGVGILQVCRFLSTPHFSGVMVNPNFTPPPIVSKSHRSKVPV